MAITEDVDDDDELLGLTDGLMNSFSSPSPLLPPGLLVAITTTATKAPRVVHPIGKSEGKKTPLHQVSLCTKRWKEKESWKR